MSSRKAVARRRDKHSEAVVRAMLLAIGENPRRSGLRETPSRVRRAWREWFEGYRMDPAKVLKAFSDKANQMVVVSDIPIYSFCEHHAIPFFGTANVAYIPNGRVVGLSKIARVVDIFAHRLQIQERMTEQIADALQEHLKPRGVGVVINCRHLCMESRGIRRPGAFTTTSALRGAIDTESSARAEFLQFCHRKP